MKEEIHGRKYKMEIREGGQQDKKKKTESRVDGGTKRKDTGNTQRKRRKRNRK